MIVSKTISKIASYESKCTGCGACANVCPKGAIHFVERRGYFRFPEIDETLCTQGVVSFKINVNDILPLCIGKDTYEDGYPY